MSASLQWPGAQPAPLPQRCLAPSQRTHTGKPGRPPGFRLSDESRERIRAGLRLRFDHDTGCDTRPQDPKAIALVVRCFGTPSRLALHLRLGHTSTRQWPIKGRIPPFRIPAIAALMGCSVIALRYLLEHGRPA